jgi:hypothetical protein
VFFLSGPIARNRLVWIAAALALQTLGASPALAETLCSTSVTLAAGPISPYLSGGNLDQRSGGTQLWSGSVERALLPSFRIGFSVGYASYRSDIAGASIQSVRPPTYSFRARFWPALLKSRFRVQPRAPLSAFGELGAGMALAKLTIGGAPPTTEWSTNKWRPAGAVGIGLAARLTRRIEAEMGFEYVQSGSLGEFHIVQILTKTTFRGLRAGWGYIGVRRAL